MRKKEKKGRYSKIPSALRVASVLGMIFNPTYNSGESISISSTISEL